MDKKDYIKLAEGLNIKKSVRDRKEYAKKIMKFGVRWFLPFSLEDALEEMDMYPSDIKNAMYLVEQEEEIIKTYGENGRRYIVIFDKCIDLRLDHHYFVDHCSAKPKNRYVLEMDNVDLMKYPILYSISTFSSNYNCTIQIENFRYDEKFVHLKDFGQNGIVFITKLLESKVNELLAYRERMAWKGDLNLEEIVAKVRPMFPKLDIQVRIGRRGCDYPSESYKAIVVYDGKCQMGSMTLNLMESGVASLTCRVPLCGESHCDVSNDSVIDAIADDIRFMIS